MPDRARARARARARKPGRGLGLGRGLGNIHRDTRFSRGIHFFHESAKAAASVPGFYLHLQPGESFAAASIWHPDPESLARIRNVIANGNAEWKALRKSKLKIEGGALKRPPRGFAPDHPFIDDLKRTDFVTSIRLDDKDVAKYGFIADFAKECKTMTPLVRFISKSLDLPW